MNRDARNIRKFIEQRINEAERHRCARGVDDRLRFVRAIDRTMQRNV